MRFRQLLAGIFRHWDYLHASPDDAFRRMAPMGVSRAKCAWHNRAFASWILRAIVTAGWRTTRLESARRQPGPGHGVQQPC